ELCDGGPDCLYCMLTSESGCLQAIAVSAGDYLRDQVTSAHPPFGDLDGDFTGNCAQLANVTKTSVFRYETSNFPEGVAAVFTFSMISQPQVWVYEGCGSVPGACPQWTGLTGETIPSPIVPPKTTL